MAPPGGVLACDLALRSGWAYGDLNQRPVWGSWNLGKMADGLGTVFCRLEDEMHDAIVLHRPRAVVYEAPFIAGRQQHAEVAKLLMGLATVAEMISSRHSVRCYHQTANQARSKVLGKAPTGGSDKIKPVIIAWARGRGWDLAPNEDDEADALLLVQYGAVILDTTRKASFYRHGDKL